MNPWKPDRTEWRTFLVLMPVLNVVINLLLFGRRFLAEPPLMIASFTVLSVIIFISWYLHIASMHLLRVRFPNLSQTLPRVLLLAAAHLTLVSTSMIVMFYGYDAFHLFGYTLNEANFFKSLMAGVALTLIASTLWEGEFIFNKWKESLEEKEQIEQLTLQREFDTLKSQVNPHFLFNCFNTLSSLITEDPARAEKFLDELSKVYRYLLRSNEDGLSTLKSELRFIQSYFELLKTRHGNAIQIQIEVDKKYEQYLIPSLSLQLVVENAVKHNMISKNQPLVIDIFTTAGHKLVVNNNLQRKAVKAPSNRVGIHNIRTKYEILAQPGFQVVEDKRNYTVVLPLMWSNIRETSNTGDLLNNHSNL